MRIVLEDILRIHFESQEFEDIRQKYLRGELKEEEQDFEEYIIKHKSNILEHKPWMDTLSKTGEFKIATIVKLYIILEAKGSLNGIHEAKRQIEEMNKEAYFLSEKEGKDQKCNMNNIAIEWAKKHAAGWRDHEQNIYCVFATIKEDFCKKLLDYLLPPAQGNNSFSQQATA